MKRGIMSLILLLSLAFSLTACGEKPQVTAGEENKPQVTAEIQKSTEVPSPMEPELPGLETEFWKLSYSDDWTFDEKDDLRLNEGHYAEITLKYMDGDDQVASVAITGEIDDPSAYRDFLKRAGIDAYSMVTNGDVETTDIGGVDMIRYDSVSWGEDVRTYYARIEQANMTAIVQIYGDIESELVAQLLSTLIFKAKDIGHVDPPWPWNGEPFTAEDHNKMIGTFTIESKQILIDESLPIDDIFSGIIAAHSDTLYILSDGALKQYAYDGAGLTYIANIATDSEYKNISMDHDGTLYLSAFMKEFIGMKDGAKTFSFNGPKIVAMHPSGKWGISRFTSPDVEKITFSGGTLSTEAWKFEELTLINTITIGEDEIYVTGNSVKTGYHAIFVYDLNGNLQTSFGEEENRVKLGSVTSVIKTQNGYFAVDGNMRLLHFWTLEGNYIGALDDGDLLGTGYPWMSTAIKLSDGSILLGLAIERLDESADEFVLYRLTGF